MHLEGMSPPARAANLQHFLLCYRAELCALHRMVHAASSHTEAARVLNTPWSPQPRQALALTHVVDMLLLYRRIFSGGVMTIFEPKYTEWYEKRDASVPGKPQASEGRQGHAATHSRTRLARSEKEVLRDRNDKRSTHEYSKYDGHVSPARFLERSSKCQWQIGQWQN